MTGSTTLSPTTALDDLIRVLGEALAGAEPMSQRARVLASVQRFAARAREVLEGQARGEVPFRLLATVLQVRDMARNEQQWIDDFLRDESPAQEHLDLLHLYKVHLAAVEATSMNALAYFRSDKEDSDEAGWWAHHAGQLVMQTMALVPTLLSLPEDKRRS